MLSEEWWNDDKNFIKEIDNSDYGLTHLMGFKEDESWLYAIVQWRHKVCTLLTVVKDGKVQWSHEYV